MRNTFSLFSIMVMNAMVGARGTLVKLLYKMTKVLTDTDGVRYFKSYGTLDDELVCNSSSHIKLNDIDQSIDIPLKYTLLDDSLQVATLGDGWEDNGDNKYTADDATSDLSDISSDGDCVIKFRITNYSSGSLCGKSRNGTFYTIGDGNKLVADGFSGDVEILEAKVIDDVLIKSIIWFDYDDKEWKITTDIPTTTEINWTTSFSDLTFIDVDVTDADISHLNSNVDDIKNLWFGASIDELSFTKDNVVSLYVGDYAYSEMVIVDLCSRVDNSFNFKNFYYGRATPQIKFKAPSDEYMLINDVEYYGNDDTDVEVDIEYEDTYIIFPDGLTSITNSGCYPYGTLPNIQKLHNLESLSLSSGNYYGHITDTSYNQSLNYINLSYNKLGGSIPSFSSNTELEKILLNKNVFTGELPEFTTLEKLTYIDVSYNELYGNVPSFANNTELEYIYIGSNNFTGDVPTMEGNDKLVKLQASYNNFSGSLDNVYFDKVTYVYLNNNGIGGNLPDLSNTENLLILDLGDNELDGFTGGTISINGGSIYLDYNKFPQSVVDSILKALVDGDTTNTRIYLNDGDNEEPSDDGKSYIDILRDDDHDCYVKVTGGY